MNENANDAKKAYTRLQGQYLAKKGWGLTPSALAAVQ